MTKRKKEMKKKEIVNSLSGIGMGSLLCNSLLGKSGTLFFDDKKSKVYDCELIEKKKKDREIIYRGYTITQTNKECSFEIAYDTLDDTVIAIDDLIKSGDIMEGKKK